MEPDRELAYHILVWKKLGPKERIVYLKTWELFVPGLREAMLRLRTDQNAETSLPM